MTDVTLILSAIEQGDPRAAEQLLPLVYDELRELAARKLAHEKSSHTLQATALVHEAYLRLVDVDKVQNWDCRRHFRRPPRRPPIGPRALEIVRRHLKNSLPATARTLASSSSASLSRLRCAIHAGA
jgi:ECF sigma factor